MPLINPRDLLRVAHSKACGVGAFNVDSVDMAWGVLAGAEAASSPVILQVTRDTLDIWGWNQITGALTSAARSASVGVALHLDHCSDISSIRRAVDLGFTSVMYDGSVLPLEENTSRTCEVISLVRQSDVMVEAELGHVARAGEPDAWEAVTAPQDAVQFVKATDVHALAVAIGTYHGKRVDDDSIRYEVLRAIRKSVECPLVLHGSSGVSDSALRKIVSNGISKVNIGSELRVLWWKALEGNQGRKPREALSSARDAIATYVAKKLQVLGSDAITG